MSQDTQDTIAAAAAAGISIGTTLVAHLSDYMPVFQVLAYLVAIGSGMVSLCINIIKAKRTRNGK